MRDTNIDFHKVLQYNYKHCVEKSNMPRGTFRYATMWKNIFGNCRVMAFFSPITSTQLESYKNLMAALVG